ncbi:hypothetical protein OAL96_00755 [bacterium]|nr:hypothetical protein [bacterium]
MSDFNKWETRLTPHALLRLGERTSMTPDILCDILDNNKNICLGTEINSSRESKLIFSGKDDKFFIVVQDNDNGYVVTILTIEYWHNLSEKHFHEKRIVSKNKLIQAVQMGDKSNLLLQHPPILSNRVINFSSEINSQKFVNCGSLDIDQFLHTPTDNLSKLVKDQFTQKLRNRISAGDIVTSTRWGVGKEPKTNNQIFDNGIDYDALINAVKNDIYTRKMLSKKYDDFLIVLNRRKQLNNELL